MQIIWASILFIFLSLMFAEVDVNAGWKGPDVIIKAGWGNGENEFRDYREQDPPVIFPSFLDVSFDGHIAITDGRNGRFKIYNPSGRLIGNIRPPLENPYEWVINPRFVASNVVLLTKYIFFFSVDGKVVNSVLMPNGGNFSDATATTSSHLYIKTRKPEQWLVYSSSGELIKTSAERPLDLGKVDMQEIGTNNYSMTITYPDKSFRLMLTRRFFDKYLRDNRGRINIVSGKLVTKYSNCGRELGSLTMPEGQWRVERNGNESLVADFGVPVVATNGDVYTWKATPTEYSILKWTWIDDSKWPEEPCEGKEGK